MTGVSRRGGDYRRLVELSESLLSGFEDAGYERIDPPMLHDAAHVVLSRITLSHLTLHAQSLVFSLLSAGCRNFDLFIFEIAIGLLLGQVVRVRFLVERHLRVQLFDLLLQDWNLLKPVL